MTRTTLLAAVAAAVVLSITAAGCHKAAIEEVFDPQLLVSHPRVAFVPGGSETVTVTSTDEHNAPQSFSAECDDEAIASVTKTDSTLTITGLSLGTANVRVFCNADTTLNRTIPVEVYDPRTIIAGELLIAFADTFEYRWSTGKPGNWCDASFYHPVLAGDFKALGSLGDYWYFDPNGTKCIAVVKAIPGSGALKPPVDYELAWDSRGAGTEDDGSLWTPIPPAGYKALGTVAQRGLTKPSLDDVVCVREDLTVPGKVGGHFFICGSNMGTGKAYAIDPPEAGPHDSCHLMTGAFTGTTSPDSTTGHPVLYVLRVKLPQLAEAPDQSFAPRLSGYDLPPEQTDPVMSKELSVPYSILKDDSQHPEIWRFTNSPTYRVERQVFYKLLYHNYNQTSELQTNSWEIKTGVEQSASQTFNVQTGVSLSVEAGVSANFLFGSGHVTTTATWSMDLGFERQTGIREFEEKTVSTSINVAPGKAAALWQRFNRFVVKRHNGNTLEPVATFEFGVDSYVTDEFPHEE
jgi:hypothetical protein